jgi:excisionase family DNA binding protein
MTSELPGVAPPAEQIEPYLRVEQVAEILGVEPKTVRRWTLQGLLPHYKLGSRAGYRFRRSDVDRFMATTFEPARPKKVAVDQLPNEARPRAHPGEANA